MNVCIAQHKYGVSIDDPCCYGLGSYYISSVLKRNGHKVKVLNFNLWDYDFKEEIKDQDVVLFGGYEEFRPYIIRDAQVCKTLGIKTILGSALATYQPNEMLQHVDTVILGEGEEVIEQALTTKGKIYGRAPDLDALPLPDYDGFGIDEYHKRHKIRYMGVLTIRGCPYDCKFCAHTCMYQRRSLDHVFDEIDHYKAKYGAEMIVFNDNTLNVSKKRFMAVCEGMRSRSLAWSAAIRCDNFDEETATAAKESGACYFVVGVESFQQSKLDAMRKRIKAEQVRKTLDLLHTHGLDYHGNVLFGLPGETALDVVDELTTMPKGYKVFPVFVQGFVGTSLAGEDKITSPERQKLSGYFKQLIQAGQKYMYPELAA